MTKTVSTRYGTERSSAETDDWPARPGWQTILDLIEGKSVRADQGLLANRPPAGMPGGNRVYYAIDVDKLYWDDAVVWTQVSPIGSNSAPTSVGFTSGGTAAVPGVSRVGAPEDHRHPVAPWPVTINNSRQIQDAFIGVGGFRDVISTGIGAAPAGNWLFGFTLILGTQSAAADAFTTGNIRMTVAMNPSLPAIISLTDDMRADMRPAIVPYSFSRPYQLPAGDITLNLSVQCNNAVGQIRGHGSQMWAVYLGPA